MKKTDKGTYVTGIVELEYASLEEAEDHFKTGKPKFSAWILFEKGNPDDDDAVNTLQEVFDEFSEIEFKNENPIHFPLMDGEQQNNRNLWGSWVLKTSSPFDKRPLLVDTKKKLITDKGQVVSGCFGKAEVRFKPYRFTDKKTGEIKKGVTCAIKAFQLLNVPTPPPPVFETDTEQSAIFETPKNNSNELPF